MGIVLWRSRKRAMFSGLSTVGARRTPTAEDRVAYRYAYRGGETVVIAERFSFETLEGETAIFTQPRPRFSETSFRFPPELGHGGVQFIQLQDELGLNVVDQWTPDELVVDRPDGPPAMLQFAFYLSGDGVTAETVDIDRVVPVNSGDSILLPPIVQARLTIPQRRHFHVVLVLAKRSLLYPFLQMSGTSMCRDFVRYLEGGSVRPYFHKGRISSAMRIVLHEIIRCPYRGPLRHIYLEAKALELIALRLEPLLVENPTVRVHHLRATDVERIHDARDILLKDVSNPPTLTELARDVGVNVNKLKFGFREVFDAPVFAYLREQRLQLARLLLKEGRHNVSETAYAIGYSDLSYFARVFRSRFGLNPSDLLRSRQS